MILERQSVSGTIHRISLAQYDQMIEHGIFDVKVGSRVELIHGEIREMLPIGPRHEDAVDLLARWSIQNTDQSKVRVRIQNSIGLRELQSAPEPDLTWVREQSYQSGRPQAVDVLLVIEVSDSSLDYDRAEKAELYASTGITDYWIVNLRDSCVEVYRNPSKGEYREKQTYEVSDSISPLQFPKISLEVSRIFGRDEKGSTLSSSKPN